jgi:hypothetical protein
MEYVKQRTQWSEAGAVKTTGGQVQVFGQSGTFFCQGGSRAVLAVQRADRTSGNGTYAELWPVSW